MKTNTAGDSRRQDKMSSAAGSVAQVDPYVVLLHTPVALVVCKDGLCQELRENLL